MKLQFITQLKPNFRLLKHPRGILHFKGNANFKWQDLADKLAEGHFPHSLRGNFAFIWIGQEETIAAVDHVCSYPLFYSDKKISHIFHELISTLPESRINPKVKAEIELLGGQTFYDDETTYVGAHRILPGHYLRNGKQFSYINFFDYCGDESAQSDYFSTLVEKSISELVTDHNLLLLSGGTDSTAIAGVVKKLKIEDKFKFVHAYSRLQPLTERPLVEKIAREMKLDVIYEQIEYSGNILPTQSQRQFSFWIENPFLAKRLSVENSGHSNCRIFTGELGDQLFGGPKNSALLCYALQSEGISAEEIAIAWINLSATYGRSAGVKPSVRLRYIIEDNEGGREAYENLLNKLAQTFSRIKSKDYLNRIMLMNYVVKGPYRTWAYSQDEFDWVHPFASWDLFDYVFRLKSSERINAGGVQKKILLDCWRNHLSELPWRMPKQGFGIPSLSKLRREPKL